MELFSSMSSWNMCRDSLAPKKRVDLAMMALQGCGSFDAKTVWSARCYFQDLFPSEVRFCALKGKVNRSRTRAWWLRRSFKARETNLFER